MVAVQFNVYEICMRLYAGMEIDMQGSILGTKSMDLECIILPMAIVTKGHGTKDVSKASVCTLSETSRVVDAANGMQAISSTLCPLLLT